MKRKIATDIGDRAISSVCEQEPASIHAYKIILTSSLENGVLQMYAPDAIRVPECSCYEKRCLTTQILQIHHGIFDI